MVESQATAGKVVCWLVRNVYLRRQGKVIGGGYARPVLLPYVPRVGEGVAIQWQQDPEQVERVYVNHHNQVVVELKAADYPWDEFDDDDGKGPLKQLAYETGGWLPLSPAHVCAEENLRSPECHGLTPATCPVPGADLDPSRHDPFESAEKADMIRRYMPPYSDEAGRV